MKGLLEDKNIVARSLVNTQIIAPVNGIIANSSLQVGNFINPGRVLFFVVQDEQMYVKANFKETQIAKLQPKQKVNYSLILYQKRSYTAEYVIYHQLPAQNLV